MHVLMAVYHFRRIYHLAVKQFKIRRVAHIKPCHRRHHFIEQIRARFVQFSLFSAAALYALDNLKPLLPQMIHFNKFLRRVLHIGIDYGSAVTPAPFKSRKNCGILTEITRKSYAFYPSVVFVKRAYFLPCSVRGSVIDINQFIVYAALSSALPVLTAPISSTSISSYAGIITDNILFFRLFITEIITPYFLLASKNEHSFKFRPCSPEYIKVNILFSSRISF